MQLSDAGFQNNFGICLDDAIVNYLDLGRLTPIKQQAQPLASASPDLTMISMSPTQPTDPSFVTSTNQQSGAQLGIVHISTVFVYDGI